MTQPLLLQPAHRHITLHTSLRTAIGDPPTAVCHPPPQPPSVPSNHRGLTPQPPWVNPPTAVAYSPTAVGYPPITAVGFPSTTAGRSATTA